MSREKLLSAPCTPSTANGVYFIYIYIYINREREREREREIQVDTDTYNLLWLQLGMSDQRGNKGRALSIAI